MFFFLVVFIPGCGCLLLYIDLLIWEPYILGILVEIMALSRYTGSTLSMPKFLNDRSVIMSRIL